VGGLKKRSSSVPGTNVTARRRTGELADCDMITLILIIIKYVHLIRFLEKSPEEEYYE